jgi:hypothetical protein
LSDQPFVKPVKGIGGGDHVILQFQAIVPIAIPKISNKGPSWNSLTPIHPDAHGDQKHIAIDTIDL